MTIATQATLAALLAKTLTAPATEAKQDTGNTSLATIATNTTSLATAAGQTATGTKLDTLHTDLTGALTTQYRSTNVTGTIAAISTGVDGTTDLSAYTQVRVQITGTFVGTLQWQVSDDGTNWLAGRVLMSAGTSTSALQTTGVGIWHGEIGARYLRIFSSAWTSGTATVTVQYTAAPATGPTTLAAGTNVVGAVQIGATTLNPFATTSAASTNATSVSGSARTLQEVTISNVTATAVYFKLYNKASAPTVGTDTPIATFPVAATSTLQLDFGANGKRFNTGLAWALTAAVASTDTTAVGAGILISGTYI